MKRLPFLLVYSRLVLAVLIGIIAWINCKNSPGWMLTLISIGLATDILDGMIARRLGIATKTLRVWNSNVDQFFWIVVIFSVFYLNFHFIQQNYLPAIWQTLRCIRKAGGCLTSVHSLALYQGSKSS